MKLLHSDCLEALKSFADSSIDSVVTDPPYHLTSIVKRFGATNAAPAKFGKDGAFARASAGFMGQTWDGGDIAFRVELWSEIFRVLKPGGHVLAFSGTRTYHRMACAIEDAGFEIRDQIGWAYGSGFPKSHDVSKGIDAKTLTGRARTEDMRKLAMGSDYEPSGRGRVNYDHGGGSAMNGGTAKSEPLTDAAKQWQGWGTALKPAWEPICVARKPLISKKIDVLNTIEAQLKEIGFQEIKWKKRPVKPVKKQNHTKNFTSTRPLLTAETYVENVRDSETQEIGNNSESVIENVDEGGLATTIQENLNYQESTIENFVSKFLKLMETNVNVAEKLKSPFYVSTILMEEALNTENPLDIEKFILNLENQDFQKGIGYCVGIVTGLSGSMATVHIKHEDGVFEWPYELPKVIPEKYLTVAENVLTHGTGALNIDGCRVEHVTVEGGNLALNPHLRKSINGGNGGNIFPTEEERRVVTPNALGRWPANLIHDGSDEVLAAFPESKGAQGAVKGTEKPKVGTNTFGDYGQRPLQDIRGDSGSAARFFYCAKTSKKERNQGCNDLIQWENLDLNHENQFLISLLKDISEDTTLILKDIEWNTILFGKKQMDKSQTDMMFIIKMVSKQIIALKTSNFSQNSIIKDYILDVIKQSMERGLNLVEIVENIKQLKQNIIDEKMGLVLGAVIAVSEMLLRIKDKGKVGNFHATVKPIALMAYLCRLVTPPNGTVLDPFMGSGSTGIAAQKEGFDFIGIEREENYFKIARKRIAENKKDDLSEIL